MAWSVAAGYRADDPTSTLSAVLPAGRKQRKHHRYLPADDFREALVKVQAFGAWVGTRLALRFLALTAPRTGEVRGARWWEVDQESATLVVPSSRMKSRKEHRVPLSSAALVVLERADRLGGRGRGLVVPGIQGKMVGAAVFGRLLNDLKIDCSPLRLPQFVPVVVFRRGDRPEAGRAGLGSRGRRSGRVVLCAERRAGAPPGGHGDLGGVSGRGAASVAPGVPATAPVEPGNRLSCGRCPG